MTEGELLKAKRACPVILVIAVTWFANFLHFTSFGFYEDDWQYFAPAYLYSFGPWFGMLRREVTQFHLGRPLQDASLRVFGYIGAAFSSISLLYIFAFIFWSVSSLLMYRVVRIQFPVRFAAIAALFFSMSPLITIKQHLNSAFTVGPAFIFLFLAVLLYNRNRKLLSLVCAVAALLTYESLFVMYLAAPLVRRGRFSKRRLMDFALHLGACAGVLIVYILLRRHFAEPRVGSISSGPLETLRLAAGYCGLFAISSFKSYLYAAWVGLRDADIESVFYCMLLFIPALVLCLRGWPDRNGRYTCARRRLWLQAAIASLLLTALGYSLSYFYPEHKLGYPLSGRATRMSDAATIPSSLLAAAVLSWIGESRSRLWSTMSRVLTVASLATVFLYCFVIQRDYVDGWIKSRRFLTQAIMLTPDVGNDSYIIVKAGWLMESLFPKGERRPSIGFSRHGLQVSMASLLVDKTAPRMFFVYSDEWRNYLKLHSDQKLYWTQESFPGGWDRNTAEPITPGRIIVMNEDDKGMLTRSNMPVWVGGQQVAQLLQPPTGVRLESNWPYLHRSALFQKVVPGFVMTAAMSNLAEAPARPPVRIAGGLSPDTVMPAGEGGTIERGPPLRVTTAANSGYFAASFPIRVPPDLAGARYAFLRVRVLQGRAGFGVADPQTRMLAQKTAEPSPFPVDLYLPVIASDGINNLIVYNAAAAGVRSEILIEDMALVVPGPPESSQALRIAK